MTSPAFKAAFPSFIFTLLIWLQWIQISLALRGDSGCKGSICVSATLEGDVVTYEMTSLTKSTGWMALGFGPHMTQTHSVIMWHNEDGTTTLSQRYASGYYEPKLADAPRLATISKPSNLVNRPTDSTTYAFQIPANHSLLQGNNPSESLIFACSFVRPDKEPDATLARHKRIGHLTLDLTKEFVPPVFPVPNVSIRPTKPATSDLNRQEKVIILHASLVSFGFLVLLPTGSLIGRLGRSFTSKWFKAHWICNMAFALPVITLGVLLGPVIVYMKPSFRIHFANSHEVCGVIILLLYYTQVALGRYIHERRIRSAIVTSPHPPLNILHICLGVSIIGLSFFQIRSGLQWWETLTGRPPITPWAYPFWRLWIVTLPLVYFSGYVLLPRQLRLEREAVYVRIATEAAEANAESSQFQEEEFEQDSGSHGPTKAPPHNDSSG